MCIDLIKKWLGINGDCKLKLDECQKKLKELEMKLKEDTEYYEERIKTLEKLLLEKTKLPNLSYLSGKVIEVNPRDLISISKYAQADFLYYALDYNDWIKVLTEISKTFDRTWKKEVHDCDDIALVFNAMLVEAVYKSKFKRTFALGIAWSSTHAFNIIITKTNDIFIYEPQTNRIIGKMNEITNSTYKVKEVWFIG